MKEWIVEVEYTARGEAYLDAETREEALERLANWDVDHDKIIEGSFEEFKLDTLKENV